MNADLFASFASLTMALPPIVDGAIVKRLSKYSAQVRAVCILLVGLSAGSLAGLLNYLANGGNVRDGAALAGSGFVSGLATGLVHLYQAGDTGGSGEMPGTSTPTTTPVITAPGMQRRKLVGATAFVFGAVLFACGASAPQVDTTQVLTYGEGLAACETKEAAFDGGPDARMGFYIDCKHRLGVDAGGL